MKRNNTTNFGFKKVLETEKSALVQDVFTNVSSKYDLMNDLMSLGIHRLWKDSLMDWLNPQPNQSLLDVAGGTGDIAFRFLNRVKGRAKVTVLDLTEGMLQEGRKRSQAENFSDKIEWVCGDAMSLPFEEKSFDIYAISFGIRNVTDIETAIAEAYRVLKIGGRIMVLEFGKIPDDFLQAAYDMYSFKIIPKLGKLVAGDEESYQYLVESIRKFPKQEKFSDMIKGNGFKNVKYRNLSFGITALHSGWKI